MGSYECGHCSKSFSSSYNVRRHEATSCRNANNAVSHGDNSEEIDHFNVNNEEPTDDQSVTMSTEEEKDDDSYTDEGNSEEEDEDDDTDEGSSGNDEELEEDNSAWELILNEVYEKMDPIRDALVQKTMQENDSTLLEAVERAYVSLLPEYTKEMVKVYKKYVRMLKSLQRDSVHKKIMRTIKRLMDREDYDEDESIDAALNQRKFLLQRMLTYASVMENSDTREDQK